ncbi:MAG: hypothetical protein ACOY3P_16830, partial [Planctomycetota bacterium]
MTMAPLASEQQSGGSAATCTIPDVWSFLFNGADGAAESQFQRQRLAELRRETLVRPAIFIGAGTCGLGAGAMDSIAKVHDYLERREIKADVVKVGCIGLCSAEPIVEVQVPGRCRLVYEHITADRVEALLDAVFAGNAPE